MSLLSNLLAFSSLVPPLHYIERAHFLTRIKIFICQYQIFIRDQRWAGQKLAKTKNSVQKSVQIKSHLISK